MMGGMMERILERMMGNELSEKNVYACLQLDTCHVGSYFGPLVPNFGTWDKIIIDTLYFKKY
jgi:hypothetical protein